MSLASAGRGNGREGVAIAGEVVWLLAPWYFNISYASTSVIAEAFSNIRAVERSLDGALPSS